MPRQSKGPRLYLRKGRVDAKTGATVPDRWFIRDGAIEIGTGCGVDRLEEAERKLADHIAAKWTRPAGESDPAKVLVAEVLALYSQDRGQSLRSDPATMQGFVTNLLAFWREDTVSEIRRTRCQEYVAWRTAQKRKGFKDPDEAPFVSTQTARRELEFLSAAVGHWDEEHHLTRRPKVVLPAKLETNRDALTRSQAAALLWATMGWDRVDGRWVRPSTNARTNRMHVRRFIILALYSGSRSGVVTRLRWTESLTDPWVDLANGIVYRRGRREAVAGNKRRPVFKPSPRLLAHMRRWHEDDSKRGIDSVVHFNGKPVSKVRTAIESCVAGAGLGDVTAHWLRHTAATWLMEAGVDPWQAAGWLGMNVATLAKHYGHHRPDHQSAARRALG